MPKDEELLRQAMEALEWFYHRRSTIQNKFSLYGPQDTAEAMKPAFNNVEDAYAKLKERLNA